MVLNKLSLGATVLMLAAAILFTLSITFKEFAKAEVRTTELGVALDDCVIGGLGVYQSVYTPQCAGKPGAPFEGKTQEFWPTFPAQNQFGQQVEGGFAPINVMGIGATKFTNCDDYMPLNFNQSMNAFAPVVLNTGMLTLAPMLFTMVDNSSAQVWGGMLQGAGFANDMSSMDTTSFDAAAAKLGSVGTLPQTLCKQATTYAQCVGAILQVAILPTAASTKTFSDPLGTTALAWPTYATGMFGVLNTSPIPGLKAAAPLWGMGAGLSGGCVGAKATNVEECAKASALPADLSANGYVLASMFSSTGGSYFDFAAGASKLNASSFPPDSQASLQVLLASTKYAALCKAQGLNTPNSCYSTSPMAFALTVQVFNGFYSKLDDWIKANAAAIPVASQETQDSFVQELIVQCKNNDKDLDAIDFAQSLMIACLVFAWLAFVLGAMFSFVGHAKLPIVSGLCALLAAILSIVGLLRIANAPIYSLIGGECADGATCYTDGVAKTLAIAGIAVAAAACILYIVSAFCCLAKGTPADEQVEEAKSSGPVSKV
mmetsp:Transcript_26021/g.56576  ORF Transcript_26021/g.56576 Transcript_26021/m.56576 type:complete len:545 (-) Transcript_26021:46-1680(-)